MTATRTGIVLALVAALAGCDGDAPDQCASPTNLNPIADLATSGTRLALNRYRFDDGSLLWRGDDSDDSTTPERDDSWGAPPYHDRLRGEDCVARRWHDGTTRCTPPAVPNDDRNVYVDAACAVPAAAGTGAATFMTTADCVRTVETYVWLGLPSVDPHPWRRTNDGTCVQDTATYGTFSPIVSEHSATEFVELTIQSVSAADDQVALLIERSDDGMARPHRLHDLRVDSSCQFTPVPYTPRSHVTCTPEALPFGRPDHYADESCQDPRYEAMSCGEPQAFWYVRGEQCGSDQIRELIPAGAPTHEEVQHVGCLPLQTAPAGEFLQAGDSLDVLEYDRCPGTGGRIAPMYVRASSLRLHTGLYDTQLGMECRMRETADGALRCVPLGNEVRDDFWLDYADAECTQPLVFKTVSDYQCEQPPPPALVRTQEHPTRGQIPFEVRITTGLHAGPVYTRNLDGQCAPVDDPSPYLFDVGPPIPLDQLAAATVVHD